MKERVCVYNNSFFLVSETFMYQQVKSLAETYNVNLIAKEFENPHGFSLNSFEKTNIKKPSNFLDRIAGKLIRSYYKSDLDIGLSSYLKIRELFKKENCKAIHAHFGPRALEILGFAKNFRVPLVVTFHGHDASRMLKDKAYVNRLPELFEYVSAIIIVSGHMMDSLKLERWKEKVFIIPCSVDPSQFSNNGKSVRSGAIKILHVGRLVGKKGVPDLIKIFGELTNKYQNIELHVAGNGKELSECRELARKFDIENMINFYGGVSHDKVKELMEKSDIFVLNSRTDEDGDMEGTPVTLLEAMCMGKAVVSTRHAGIPFVIEHGKNGLLAREKANDELKEQIDKLIKNEGLRKKLGDQAKITVHESYSTSVMQKKIQQVFESI